MGLEAKCHVVFELAQNDIDSKFILSAFDKIIQNGEKK